MQQMQQTAVMAATLRQCVPQDWLPAATVAAFVRKHCQSLASLPQPVALRQMIP
jgi:hypothetical protein